MNLLFAGDAELAPAAELLAPAAVVFPRSAPDVERKPAGKEIHPRFTLGRFRSNYESLQGNRQREGDGSEPIPHNMKCWSSLSPGGAALGTVPTALLVKVLRAAVKVVSLGTLAAAATVLLGSAPAGKRKPTGEEM